MRSRSHPIYNQKHRKMLIFIKKSLTIAQVYQAITHWHRTQYYDILKLCRHLTLYFICS